MAWEYAQEELYDVLREWHAEMTLPQPPRPEASDPLTQRLIDAWTVFVLAREERP